MSALGHSRPSHFVPVLNNVRYASDSDHSRYESELTLWAKSCREYVQQKSAIERQVMSLTDSAYCGTLANACRPRWVMMYNEQCLLCGSSVTYCSSTKRASPARDSGELTLRPRSPAARNAFRNQISSLVKSKPALAVPLRKPAATSTSGFNYAVFQPRQLYRPISLRFSSYSARSISPRARR
jgi:hypothetical protein